MYIAAKFNLLKALTGSMCLLYTKLIIHLYYRTSLFLTDTVRYSSLHVCFKPIPTFVCIIVDSSNVINQPLVRNEERYPSG